MPARFRDNRSECGECRPLKRRRGGALIAPLLKIEALRPSEGRSTSPSPGGESRRMVICIVNLNTPTPTLPRKREREMRGDTRIKSAHDELENVMAVAARISIAWVS
jgi:hypothetical protein